MSSGARHLNEKQVLLKPGEYGSSSSADAFDAVYLQ